MIINVDSLAAFKRFLAFPGATVTVIRHDWADAGKPGWNAERRAIVYQPRTVAKLQTNAVKWSSHGWTHWGKEAGGRGAAGFRFEGDTVTMDLSRNGSFSEVCVYRLSVAVESVAA